MNILGASIFVIYSLLSGSSYQACYQPVGGTVTCAAMTASPHQLMVLDETDYDFWVKVNGVDSEKVRWRTQKKTAPAPGIVER